MSNTQNTQDTFILFYHEQSRACQKLKQFIPSTVNINYINIANVKNIPPGITSIPALVINNNNNNKILLGKKVFNYFKNENEPEYAILGTCDYNICSNIEDDGTIGSSEGLTAIDSHCISSGVPTWNESDTVIDLNEYMAKRENNI